MSHDKMMRAAVLKNYGAPVYGAFHAPVPVSDEAVVVQVAAATINGVDRAIASGRHFLSPKALPVVAGRDGVGTTEDGRLVYFDGPLSPYGSMAEQTLVLADSLIELPPGADVTTAAVLGNAGLAAWLPLSWRAGMRTGESVAVLGAAGSVGSLAVQAARHLGAGAIVGVVRGPEEVEHAQRLGADIVVDTAETDDLAATLRAEAPGGFDVIADYLWGDVAAAALTNASMGCRLVQVGTVTGDNTVISGELLRSRGVDVMGFVGAYAPHGIRAQAYRTMVSLASEGKLEAAAETFRLEAVETAWHARPEVRAARPVLLV
ncbi:zinc-binding alcohol dehydrogenase family protein [Kitasatospora sp. NPDC092948]|uniref:quinone oxidoreductase family protein n=1 Tax=Kitasatospora sp. NPDC092948 TaxID=3364088 RepID=UPI0037FBAE4F